MFLFRKNIILVPSDFDGFSLAKGLLSFDCYSDKTKCNLHCYNLTIQKPLILGISLKNRLHKMEVSQKNCKNLQFEISEVLKNTDEISAVLIDLNNENQLQNSQKSNLYDIVLWGSTQITSGWKTSLDLMLQDENLIGKQASSNFVAFQNNKNIDDFDDINSLNKFNDMQEIKETKETKIEKDKKDELSVLIDSQTDSSALDIERFLKNNEQYVHQNLPKSENCHNDDNNIEKQNCDMEQIKQNFENFYDKDLSPTEEDYSSSQVEQIADKIINFAEQYEDDVFEKNMLSNSTKSNKILNETGDELVVEMPNQNKSNASTFFDRINHQIEYLFSTNKSENVLNEIFPNSKFCKVDFDDQSGYYVFGVIYENSEPKYLCYGVPAKKDAEPPKELSNLYQWLPVDTNNDTGDGFYMMYQDAKTGGNISVDII